MRTAWIAEFLAAIFAVALVFFYGVAAFTFPLMFLAFFFVFLGIEYFRDSISAESTPGIEEMQRPDFWFSPIYFAWLFVNDRERWANYTTILSCLGALAVSPARRARVFLFGRRHRVFFHDPASAYVIASSLYPADETAIEAAQCHIMLDELCSRDPLLKKQFEILARSEGKKKKGKREQTPKELVLLRRDLEKMAEAGKSRARAACELDIFEFHLFYYDFCYGFDYGLVF